MVFTAITGSPILEPGGGSVSTRASPFLSRSSDSVQRSKILLRQPNLIALSGPPDVAGHAAGEPLASIVDLNERLFALTAVVGHLGPMANCMPAPP